MLFLKKKNESIVCVGNWAQALHFIEQQISTCTVVATSVPSSLSPGLSVPHPILSLAYPCGKKSPLLVISRATKAQTVVFFFYLSNLPVGETLQESPSPQGGNICTAQKLAWEKDWELALCFVPPIFIFLEKEGNTCVMTQVLVPGVPLCREVSTQRCCLAGNRWQGWVFLCPTPCCRKFESHNVRRSLPVEKGWDWHVGEATQKNRMFWSSTFYCFNGWVKWGREKLASMAIKTN